MANVNGKEVKLVTLTIDGHTVNFPLRIDASNSDIVTEISNYLQAIYPDN